MDYKKMFPSVDAPVSAASTTPSSSTVAEAPKDAASGAKATPYSGMFPGADSNSGYSPLSIERTAADLGLPLAAGAGAVAGAALRHKGVELGNIFKAGENVYQAPQKSVDALNQHLRTVTGDPHLDVRGMTSAQIDRILQGGEGSTMGTSGAQRGYGYQNEQQRRSRNQHEVESTVKKMHPNLPDPIVQAGQTVPLTSGIEVPVSFARQHAASNAASTQNAVNEAQKGMRASAIKSGATKVGTGAVGGALSAVQAYDMATQPEPADWTQYLSLLGGVGAALGGQRMGALGGLAQLPNAVKHRHAIANNITGTEVNPTAFPIGMPGADEPVVGYKP